jgi:ribosomal-protein-alanine N-acetyltransferase
MTKPKQSEHTSMVVGEHTYTMRKIGHRDTEDLHQIDSLCFPPERAFTEGYFLLLFFYENAHGWALEEDGRIIAFILLTSRQNRFNVATIDVHPEYRRRGLGAALLEFAETQAKESGATAVTLQVETTNTSAIRLYHRLGYEKMRKLPNYYVDAPSRL